MKYSNFKQGENINFISLRTHRVLQGPTMSAPGAFDNMCPSLESYHIFLVNRKVGQLCCCNMVERFISKISTVLSYLICKTDHRVGDKNHLPGHQYIKL